MPSGADVTLNVFVPVANRVGGFGILFAFLSSLLAFIWFNDIQIALIMGVAMITNLLIAGILGTLIPLTLEKYKIDPAISSSVFLTTVTDVIGFFTFLGLAAWVIL